MSFGSHILNGDHPWGQVQSIWCQYMMSQTIIDKLVGKSSILAPQMGEWWFTVVHALGKLSKVWWKELLCWDW